MRPDESRHRLMEGLRGRSEEIEQAVLARIHAIGVPGRGTDPEYLEGLRLASEAAIDCLLEALERGDDRVVSVPDRLLAQARLAVGRGVPLETVLRRYLAGHAVLGDFVIEEAERQAVVPAILRQVLRSQAAATDQILATISASYVHEERAARPVSAEQRQVEKVRRLLDGELLDPKGLGYDFDRWHVALLARGLEANEAAEAVCAQFDARRLILAGDDGLVWAWIGSRERLEPERVEAAMHAKPRGGLSLGIGEPARGRAGWRLTHNQARAALSVAIRSSEAGVRYADVALLASAMQDELFTTSLRQLYLTPLESGRDGGRALRETLRAFFAVEQNVSSAAAALGVSRQTVANRLRAVEERVGRPLTACAFELQAALRLSEVGLETRRSEGSVAA